MGKNLKLNAIMAYTICDVTNNAGGTSHICNSSVATHASAIDNAATSATSATCV